MGKADSFLLQRPLRGMRDMLPEEMRVYRHIVTLATRMAERYGYQEISTPILEQSALFLRSLGKESDIVSKEMYRFTDQGEDDITLRPENTAGALRALVSAGLHQTLPQRFFYAGPMFRRERPQKGRFRQFYQCGIEILGCSAAQADIETILCGKNFVDAVISEPPILEINTIGDFTSRVEWQKALILHFEKNKSALSEISRKRLSYSPLRILDSKEKEDQEAIVTAPPIDDFLNKESRDFFQSVCEGLNGLGISFHRNPLLVRGLDYYCHTVFEFKSDHLGAQSTVLAGGRYDGLSKILGGPEIPAVGWASGIDRLILCAKPPPVKRPLFALIVLDDVFNDKALMLLEKLRSKNIDIAWMYQGKIKQKMKQASRMGIMHLLLLGEEEIKAGNISMRDMQTGEQQKIDYAVLEKTLIRYGEML